MGDMQRDSGGRFSDGHEKNGGRQKGAPNKFKDVQKILDSYLEAVEPGSETGLARWHDIIGHLYNASLKGNVKASIYLIDRKLGKPMQEIKVAGGTPIDAPMIFHVYGTIDTGPGPTESDDGK